MADRLHNPVTRKFARERNEAKRSYRHAQNAIDRENQNLIPDEDTINKLTSHRDVSKERMNRISSRYANEETGKVELPKKKSFFAQVRDASRTGKTFYR